jgi:hypothetical protein
MFIKTQALFSLGMTSLIRVLFYRLGVKFGFNPVKKISATIPSGHFFNSNFPAQKIKLQANEQWRSQHSYFGWCHVASNSMPDWHSNVLTGISVKNSLLSWWEIPDFDAQLGDIKTVWEASRFDWVIAFAQQAVSGDEAGLVKLNTWLADWVDKNPTYNGVNWKCGQEASIRVMHLALVSVLLNQSKNTTPALLSLIKAHLKRISPTVMYAVAQDNNHGTSEAAALYIGGTWLTLNGDKDGVKWQKQGLKWLENRANKLIENDGSFSQYSVTYHRVMLDTYSLVEVWRQKHKFSPFSERLYNKLKAATHWLYYFTDTQTGDAPNLGANDGARLIPLTGTDYRDFRPSVQLASTLFLKKAAYSDTGEFNTPLQWLGLELPQQKVENKTSKDFTDGGYAYLVTTGATVFLNYPKFKFRPSQCDALHIDFWLNGKNILRDGGTFSYNAGQKYIDYYGGVKSHNTVEFDSHDQMPRLSRFLLGDWLKTSTKKELIVKTEAQEITAGYKDCFGCEHIRRLKLQPNILAIEDTITGFREKAIIRFRLAPSDWQLDGNSLNSELCSMYFSADVTIKRIELTKGFESRYYYQESEIPVLEIEITEAGILTTEVQF